MKRKEERIKRKGRGTVEYIGKRDRLLRKDRNERRNREIGR